MTAPDWGRGGLMITAAVRYCLGRQSYIVGDCCEWIERNWDQWPERVRVIVRRDVSEAIKRDDEARADGREYKPLGMDMDRAEWVRVEKLWDGAK